MTLRASIGASAPISRWLLLGLLTAALSLRAPIVAPTPVLADIRADLHIDATAAGLITSAPVIMFAASTPVAALIIRRMGAEAALLACLLGVLGGTIMRSVPDYGFVIGGMVVIGASIAVGNVVVPVIIRRELPPEKVGAMTGAYAVMLNVGAFTTSAATAPLAALIGWPLAVAAFGLVTLAGAVMWGVHMRAERRRGAPPGERFSGPLPGGARPVPPPPGAPEEAAAPGSAASATGWAAIIRRPAVWSLTLMFSMQTGVYYALSTWLPTFASDALHHDAETAGALASIFQGGAIIGAVVVPVLGRLIGRLGVAVVLSVCWLALAFGLLIAPQSIVLWLCLGSLAHVGGFVVVMTGIVGISRDDREAARVSAFVQGVGYALGACAPPLIGALHDATLGWLVPLAVIAAMAAIWSACALVSSVRGATAAQTGASRPVAGDR